MQKIFLSLLLSLALYMMLCACNPTTTAPAPTPAKICSIASLKYGQTTWTMEYNANGELSKLTNSYFISDFSYRADSIIEYLSEKATGNPRDTSWFKLNADGNVIEDPYRSYTYDNNGYRKTKTEHYNHTTETYQVLNGNYVSSVTTDDLTGNVLATKTFDYYLDQENKGTNWFDPNPAGLMPDASFLMKHFGKQSKNMIKRSPEAQYICDFTNEYNGDGYISKQTTRDTTGNLPGIFDYTYICN